MTNIIYILAIFVIAICIANRFDFSATLKTNLIVIPFLLASMIFLFFTKTPHAFYRFYVCSARLSGCGIAK